MDVLTVEARERLGTMASCRLREAGKLPVVVYGKGGPTVSLAASQKRVEQLVRQGIKTFTLEGAATGSVTIKSVQWDALGSKLMHVDLIRS